MGMNAVGYLHAELGVGEAARSTLRALSTAKIPFAPVDFRHGSSSRMGETVAMLPHHAPTYPVNVFHINADQLPYAVAEFDPSFFDGRYNIGYWNWELPEFPDHWVDSCSFLDEIWAPSTFCQQAYAKKVPVPVSHIPYCIDLPIDPLIQRHHLGLPEHNFLFLFMFDALSIPERKNPLGLLQAFRRAKADFHRPCSLVIKMINGTPTHPMVRELREEAHREGDILLLEHYLDRPALNSLFSLVDSYVSLHRSEGFGLTLAESMFLGKPVIATGWSANTDFMTKENSYLLPYRLIELDRDVGPYRKGQQWADPDVESAAEAMCRVVNDPEEARAKAHLGQQTIRQQFSPAAVGRHIEARLRALGYSAR